MSTEAPNWFSEQMKNKVTHIRQARGARLMGTTRRGDATEKKVKFPIAGRGEAYELTGAIQKVKPMNASRSTVEVDMRDYEASDWIFTPDLAKLGPNEMQTTAETLAYAINRKEDFIQWDAKATFAANPAVVKSGTPTQETTPQFFFGNKAGIKGHGDNDGTMIFCPLPEMNWEQLMLYKQIANSQWQGPADLPMLNRSDTEIRKYRNVVFFTLPNEYFKDGTGASLADASPPASFYTYMWDFNSMGCETNWDGKEPRFTQHTDYEGSPWLGKAGLGGAAVGILTTGLRRLELKTLAEGDLTLPT